MNQDLRRMAEELLSKEEIDAIVYGRRQVDDYNTYSVVREAIAAALAKLTQQEPVAWMIWLYGTAGLFEHKQFAELEFEHRSKEYPDENRKLVPLYTHHIPSQQGERKPLTREEAYAISAPIFSGGNRHPSAELELVRAVEAHHNIKEQQ